MLLIIDRLTQRDGNIIIPEWNKLPGVKYEHRAIKIFPISL